MTFHMKKIFSLVLAFVLMTTSFVSFAADDEDYSDADIWGDSAQDATDTDAKPAADGQTAEEPIAEKIEKPDFSPKYSGVDRVNVYNPDDTEMLFKVLKKLGIMDSYEDFGAFVTRGEFAGFIARIMQNGKSSDTSVWRYEFKDVDETVTNRADIIYLTNHGIVQGDGEGYFYPDNNIKTSEALVMLLNAMGYYEIAQMQDDGTMGYQVLASKLKLSDEIDTNDTKELTLKSAVKLIYHALHEHVADIDSMEGSSLIFKTSDETFMYRYMEIMTIEGVVTANEHTSLSSQGGAVAANRIEIGDTTLSFSDSDIVPSDYLGLYSRVYFRENSGNYQAVFAECLEKRNKILKLKAEDILEYDKETKTISYAKNDRVKKEAIPIDASIIFNGVAMVGNIDNRCFTPNVGQVVFIDNTGDGRYDCIMIDSYATYLVKNTLLNNTDILYDGLSVQPMISFGANDARVIKDNAEVSLTDISASDVALVASSKVTYQTAGDITYPRIDTASDFYTILISDHQLKGTLESITSDKEVVIDGVAYPYSDAFLASAKKGGSSKTTDSMIMNVAVTAGLDLDGNIVWLERATDSALKYGYMVRMGVGKGLRHDLIRLFTQDNQMLNFTFADKVKVYAHWESGNIDEDTYYAKTVSGDAINTIEALYSDGETKQQLLQYKLDEDNNVSAIYIAATDTRSYTTDVPLLYDGILYKSCTVEDTYFFNYPDVGGVVSPMFEYNKLSTYGFAVPDNSNITDEKYFTAHKNTITLFTNGSPIEKMDLYNVDNGRIGAFVYKQPVTIADGDQSVIFNTESNSKNIIIENVRLVLDDNDEIKAEITAYWQNKVVSFECTSGSLVSLANENVADLNMVSVSDLKRGDIILIHQNGLEQIDGFKVLHRVDKAIDDASGGSITGFERTWDGTLYTVVQPVYPNLFARGEVVKTIDGIPYVDVGRSDGILRRMLVYGSVNQLVIYDVKNDEMTLAQNANKISDFSKLQEGDYIFWYQKERAIVTAVAIRNYK